MSRFSFSTDDAPPPDDRFTPIPPGWYTAEIVGSDAKQTKAGDGTYFNLQWKILGPSHAGRVIFEMIMFDLPRSPQAVEIGRRKLSGLLVAIGRQRMDELHDLHGQPCEVSVGIESSPGYEDKNNIKAHRAIGGAPSQPQPRHGSNGRQTPHPDWQGNGGGRDVPPPIDDDGCPF